MIWFNPPYNAAVATNVGKEFLRLVDKHFSNRDMHKYFNRNTIKISYSCMPNMSSLISSHNKKVLGQTNKIEVKGCNCGRTTTCPLDGKCKTESMIYKAAVAVGNTVSNYIGLASTMFKTRYNNHTCTFRNTNKRNNTKLAGFIWKLQDKQKSFNISWSIASLQPTFDPGTNKCQLCLMEKVLILNSDRENTINKRHEIFTKCIHRRDHLLAYL